jgi:hypothetical protein
MQLEDKVARAKEKINNNQQQQQKNIKVIEKNKRVQQQR